MGRPSRTAFLSLPLALLLIAPAAVHGQSSFAPAVAQVVSELKAQDRGDGSGSYELVTRVTDPGSQITIEHALRSDRDVMGEVTEVESMRVLEGDAERAKAGSDPTALGHWSEYAVAWAIPFANEFAGDPRRNYRPQERRVREVVQGVVPDAKVSTRAASDGRTTADVEIPGEHSVTELARTFVEVRVAIREADMGLARLRIRGRATAPVVEASTE